MVQPLPTIAVLGASGLIGQAVAEALAREGFPVVATARRFTRAQAAAFGQSAVAFPIAEADEHRLGALLAEHNVDIVLNCLGVLQDGPRGRTWDVHQGFVARLLHTMATQPRPVLLIHISIPGSEKDDTTAFSRTKREGERLIASSALPSAILRPGFVVAPVAYGGGALIRACAAMPFGLPDAVAARPFRVIAAQDIARTVAIVARRWQAGERHWKATWDLVARQPTTVGAVIESFRKRFGGPAPLWRLPLWMLNAGARAGDIAAHFGWSPPVRTTALLEMLRGVEGEPGPWIAATGLEPASPDEVIAALPASIQEQWFARLFLAKPAIIGSLVAFWIASGLIAFTVAFGPASAILANHGVPTGIAGGLTVVSSVIDILVGAAIARRQTCQSGLLAGIALSLIYMAGAALILPDLWLEPLGPLVKTLPAIMLMLVALLILDDR